MHISSHFKKLYYYEYDKLSANMKSECGQSTNTISTVAVITKQSQKDKIKFPSMHPSPSRHLPFFPISLSFIPLHSPSLPLLSSPHPSPRLTIGFSDVELVPGISCNISVISSLYSSFLS